jgi:predicted ATP-dependent endonuclease of OLD family
MTPTNRRETATMRVSCIYVRFFKAFNYDYLRKANRGAEAEPWERTADGLWYPYVRVPIEASVTPIVGANESGKSQLLAAVSKMLTGEHIERSEYCRYSPFFAVNREMARPDFGCRLEALNKDEAKRAGTACGRPDAELQEIVIIRQGDGVNRLFVPTSGDNSAWEEVKDVVWAQVVQLLPRPVIINRDTPLPASIPISVLKDGVIPADGTGLPRRSRFRSVVSALPVDPADWFGSKDIVAANADGIATALSAVATPAGDANLAAQYKLADDLLVKVAGVDRTAFEELDSALADEREGFANSVVDQINDRLAEKLNLRRWWTQDSEFELRVTPREFDLAFTIRDRTKIDYSATERSDGLRYFLSYLVQHLAHEPADDRAELFMMDEPDAYLSSQGQQDLLRIFNAIAEGSALPAQVVYVTHSPFLIDKNRAERIRVLEKGEAAEGTRVVRDAGKNHYEPLRTALGAFVAETTFMSNCNLIVEGLADQVLLAGMAVRLRRVGASMLDTLDLNTLTLVPAGGAAAVPYMLYLARGRDHEKPAVLVLLDSDAAGKSAKKELARGGPRRRELLEPRYIVEIADLGEDSDPTSTSQVAVAKVQSDSKLEQIEDLIPLSVAIAAVRGYAREFYGSEVADKMDAADLPPVDKSMFPTMEAWADSVSGQTMHLEKTGFARHVLASFDGSVIGNDDRDILLENFRVLFRVLTKKQRQAIGELSAARTTTRLKRTHQRFFDDNPDHITKGQVVVLFESIEQVLGDDIDADRYRLALREIEEDFQLPGEPNDIVADYDAFRLALDSLTYAAVLDSQETSDDVASLPKENEKVEA